MPTPLEQAIAFIKAGDTEKGKQLLVDIIKGNPRDEYAWLWMTRCVGSAAEKRYCFERVLEINPQNQHAIKGLERLNNPAASTPQPKAKVVPQQSIKKKRLDGMGIVALLGLSVFLFSVCGIFILFMLNRSGSSAQILAAEDVFEVSAIAAVEDEGYAVTSAVCEVVSSEHNVLYGMDLGKIVFHAFRITKDTLGKEVVVLFTSNHTAADGSGLVYAVNSEAVRLFPDYPDVTRRSEHPITIDTPGAQDAMDCAKEAGSPPPLDFGDFDHEAWRREAIKNWGEEETFPDGSKDDYVRLALSICKQSSAERETMLTNLGGDYEGSDQQWIIETFCPYVK